MCGLAAIMSRGGAWPRAALERATDTLRHRGPDGRGTWVGPGGSIGLGHTRLSVVGLDNGAQPIASEDGRLHLAANGEFYDFESIRRDLESRGHVFSTGSDSEIALHLYEESGRACVDDLRGEFAFVLWDEDLQMLWAVRDRFGIKPLYYADEVRRLIHESVRLRMRADVPVGCLLSGGMDSSALIGIAARGVSTPKAFTIAFDHADYDEEPVARRTARHVGADYEVVPATQADCADYFADAM